MISSEKWSSLLLWVTYSTILLVNTSCSGEQDRPTNSPNTDVTASVNQGKMFAKEYCTGCHTIPEPNLLDKNT